MIRKLIAAGILLVAGYMSGVFFGYRAAVVDYVENDAETIESMADDIYPSPEDGASQIPKEVRNAVEKQSRADGENDGSKGFQ